MSITVGFVKLEGRVPKRKYFGFIHTVYNMHLQCFSQQLGNLHILVSVLGEL